MKEKNKIILLLTVLSLQIVLGTLLIRLAHIDVAYAIVMSAIPSFIAQVLIVNIKTDEEEEKTIKPSISPPPRPNRYFISSEQAHENTLRYIIKNIEDKIIECIKAEKFYLVYYISEIYITKHIISTFEEYGYTIECHADNTDWDNIIIRW